MVETTESVFQTIINTTTDGILVVDQQGSVRFANRAVEILFERTQAEILETPFGFPVVAGETTEIDVLRRNGHVRVAEMRVTRIEWGGERAALASLRDITERKQAQDELQRLYDAVAYLFKADSLLNLGHQIVEAVVREFNQTDCGLLLADKNQSLMLRLARSGEYHVPDTPIHLDDQGLVAECMRTGKHVYAPDVADAPLYVPNSIYTRSELVIPLRTLHGVIGVLDLQSRQKHAFHESDLRILNAFAERAAASIETMQLYEEVNRNVVELEWRVAQRTAELSRAKERVEAILNNASDAIIIVHPDGSIQQANPAFFDLFGSKVPDINGAMLYELFQAERDALMAAFQRVLEDNLSTTIEAAGHRPNGNRFVAEIALAPIIRAESQETSVICILRDVTERQRIEEELRISLEREKELSELKSRFVYTASHEFRTPLSTILATAETLSAYRTKMKTEDIDFRLDKIRQQVLYLKEIMEDVLQLARIQAGRVKTNLLQGNMDRLCKDIIEEFESQEQYRERIAYQPPNLPIVVQFDEHLMRKVINNLISNALKYSPAGSPVYVRLSSSQSQIVIEVEDSGIGIPREDLKHLFEPFHRATNVGTISGTGLGLSIVQESVKMNGGEITVKSEVEVGTTFTVSIPAMLNGKQ